MEFILITPPEVVSFEQTTILYFLEKDMGKLHVRKPGWSDEELETYIKKIPANFLHNVVIHGSKELAVKLKVGGIHYRSTDPMEGISENWKGSRSRSTHSYDEIDRMDGAYDYFFLSPVFNSISKTGYKSAFDKTELTSFLQKERASKIIALGGIKSSNINDCSELGFDGIAVLGAVWKIDQSVGRLDELDKLYSQAQITFNN